MTANESESLLMSQKDCR